MFIEDAGVVQKSILPKVAMVCATTFFTSSTLRTSPVTANARPPAFVIFSAKASSLSVRRAVSTTAALLWRTAQLFPLQCELAPVTMATLPSNLPIVVDLLSILFHVAALTPRRVIRDRDVAHAMWHTTTPTGVLRPSRAT